MILTLWIIGIVIVLFGFVVFFGAPYLPSRPSDVRPAFEELYKLSKTDLLIDIGSGDGIILRMAAKKGARALGYELNPALVIVSRLLCRRYPLTTTSLQNFWRASFPKEATIVYTFGDGRDIEKMASKVEREATRLNKQLYFMSYGFELKTRPIERRNDTHFLYIVHPSAAPALQSTN